MLRPGVNWRSEMGTKGRPALSVAGFPGFAIVVNRDQWRTGGGLSGSGGRNAVGDSDRLLTKRPRSEPTYTVHGDVRQSTKTLRARRSLGKSPVMFAQPTHGSGVPP